MNIKKARKAAKLSQVDLAIACGWVESPQARISNYENERRKPSLDDLRRIAKATGISLNTLIDDNNTTIESSDLQARKTIRIPVISFVRAGQWEDAEDPFSTGEADNWRETTANVSYKSFALVVKGDSMHNPTGTPSIPEGSIVIVDPTIPAENGKIVVAKLDDTQEVTIKKLVLDGPNKYLKPLNPSYPLISISSNCSIVGVVKKVEIDL